ncbi:hypothetical protein COL5a_011129 [Colletotrichum fioriniae]|uniref:uncharacterized protein n=1 Tax=Colletotrichum fioriniae TaxID=710243 RepID=UPI002301F5CF|nr:uncharacterized protein COL516b_010462 [Colletotrichum fioriniae]KAJ0297851.1 hypothetical protein COL516b_010462 [Colletotrichum fioriniae]KAJ0317561.1 hypothetical protein COL5a_011129 [Colletotrichum fioriniae]KAJ3939059.1 hypothetical protein N0V96_011174 [Colletotrichum fioriniae]
MARTGSKRNYQSLDLAEAKRPKVESKDKKPVAAAVAVGMVARASSDSGYHSDSSAAAAAADNDNAGERLFNKQTAKRPPPSSQLPLPARLQQRFGARDESLALAYPEQFARGLYIYADGSNISVSFFNDLKKRMGISRDQRLSTSAFSFHAFRGILERGREVKEGVIVGSRNNKAGNNRSSSSVPLYLQEAEACDYTAKVLQRVPAESPSSAGSFAMKEQGVDETVQHHMRKAVLDNLGAPGVMILATGDGNLDGDMEGGFPAAVQSALANGWVVEVYHFAESAHSTWRDPRFLHNPEWDGRLTCHALDEFVFDMDAKQQQPATPLGAEVPRTAKRTRRESRPAYVPSWTLPPAQQAASVSLPPAAATAAAVTPPPSPPLEMAPASPEEMAQAGQIAELVGKLKPELIPVIAASLLRAASATPPPTAPAPAPALAPARIPSAVRGDASSFAGGVMGYFGAQLPSPPALSAFPQPYPLQYPQATSHTAALGQYQYNGVWGNQVGNYGYTR